MDVLRADGGAMGLVPDERIAITDHARRMASRSPARHSRCRRAHSGAWRATAEAWWTSDARAERAGDDVPCARRRAALVAIPLQRRGEWIGAMMLFVRAKRSFTEREMAHVEAMADLLSVALANAELVETLRKAEWRFRTLFRAAPDAVLTVLESGRIREANDAVRDVVGMRAASSSLAGCSTSSCCRSDRVASRDAVARASTAGAEARFEVRVVAGDGVRVVVARGAPAPRGGPAADARGRPRHDRTSARCARGWRRRERLASGRASWSPAWRTR